MPTKIGSVLLRAASITNTVAPTITQKVHHAAVQADRVFSEMRNGNSIGQATYVDPECAPHLKDGRVACVKELMAKTGALMHGTRYVTDLEKQLEEHNGHLAADKGELYVTPHLDHAQQYATADGKLVLVKVDHNKIGFNEQWGTFYIPDGCTKKVLAVFERGIRPKSLEYSAVTWVKTFVSHLKLA